MGTSKLGNMLVEDGLLSEADRRTIKRTCGTGGSAFARGILAMGLLDEDELAAYIAEHTSLQVAAKNIVSALQTGAWGCIDRPLIEQLEVLPLRLTGDSLQVAMVDPLDQDTISQLEFFTGYKIMPVIATMSQVRQGLQKVLPDYQSMTSNLEEFLKNHSITASKRLRMANQDLLDDLPAPDSFSVKSAGASASFGGNAVEFEDDDDDEGESLSDDGDNIEFESDEIDVFGDSASEVSGDSRMMESTPAPVPAVDDDNLFSIEDDSFTTSHDDDDSIETSAEDNAGFDTSLLDPDMNDEGPKATLTPVKAPKVGLEADDDLENLMDLSDFDPDKIDDGDMNVDDIDLSVSENSESNDLNFDLSTSDDGIASLDDDILGLTASEPKTKADAATDDSLLLGDLEGPDSSTSSDDLNFDDLGFDIGDSDLIAPEADIPDAGDLTSSVLDASETSGSADDLLNIDDDPLLSGDFSATESPEPAELTAGMESSDGELSDSELSADFSAMDLNDDALDFASASNDISETALSGEDFDFSEEAISATGDDLLNSDEALSETSLSDDTLSDDPLSFENEPLNTLSETNDDLAFDEPMMLDEDLDIAADLGASGNAEADFDVAPTTQDVSSTINKMFFNVSMIMETKAAIGAIAPDLKASGFSTGLIIGGSTQTSFRPECGWLDSSATPPPAADSLKDKGITAALGRLPSAWTPLDDAVRQGDLKVFASLQRENKRLFGIKFSNQKAGRDTVIVTAMAPEISENADLMDMAADLFRQVAEKNKGVA